MIKRFYKVFSLWSTHPTVTQYITRTGNHNSLFDSDILSEYHNICVPTVSSSGTCVNKFAFRKLYTNTVRFYFVVYNYVNLL
jgi:hypothetical protein